MGFIGPEVKGYKPGKILLSKTPNLKEVFMTVIVNQKFFSISNHFWILWLDKSNTDFSSIESKITNSTALYYFCNLTD